ncbi:ATP-binding protein [Cellulosilyticum sp. I15G10I2]|uniref:ATP-binding protein n=1 Tax=Cellulosilyticum sp. I15G10I2 TaxID=1892843 RepID=UPI00085C33D1|nr:4Fe-4S dicluster domain-containing protein [Cellulosilyticum sp. I15G10I2]
MKRKIVTIDREKCNGCGVCVSACHEGALKIINGKAELVSDIYCDGLGDCLPACPVDAIHIIEREADAYDEKAVEEHIAKSKPVSGVPFQCPSTRSKALVRENKETSAPVVQTTDQNISQLGQWPCQIQLVPPNAPYFEDAEILIAADCTAFAYAGFHATFMKNKITLIGCPKLDSVRYEEKLTQIFSTNNIKSVTVVRMEVPCCAGIVTATQNALLNARKILPFNIVTVSIDGKIL